MSTRRGSAPVHKEEPLVETRGSFHELFARADALRGPFAETAAEIDRTAAFPFANFDALSSAGLLALTVAGRDGGHDGGLLEAQNVIRTIARGEPSTALVLAMHYAHHAAIARRDRWPDELNALLVAETLAGISLINSAQVEPRAGSPTHGSLPETIAQRSPDGWLISGHKQYCTGIPILSWVSVSAVTDEPDPRIGLFLVPAKAPGVRVIETWDAVGMRATASHDVVFDNVAVPFGHTSALTPAREGMRRDESTNNWFFTLVSAVYDGVAHAARDWVVDFARTYVPGSLGAPLASVPSIRDAIGAIDIRLATNARLLESIAIDADAERPIGLGAAMVKNVVVDNAVAVTESALDIAGNQGTRRSNPLERHHRDALCGRAHAPQNSIVRASVATAVLGRPETRA